MVDTLFDSNSRELDMNKESVIHYPEDLFSEQYNSYILLIPKSWKTDEKTRPERPQGKMSIVPGKSIALYMPHEISKEHSINWQGEELGLAAKLNERTSTQNFMEEMKARGGEMARKKIGEFTGMNIETSARASEGWARNPQVRMIFQSIDHRTFSFSFTFAPRSYHEANTITMIQKQMEKSSLPGLNEEKGRFNYPDYFWIRMRTKSEGGMIDVMKFQPAIVSDLSFNLTPESVWAQFKTGQPVEVQMDITFTETQLHTRERVE